MEKGKCTNAMQLNCAHKNATRRWWMKEQHWIVNEVRSFSASQWMRSLVRTKYLLRIILPASPLACSKIVCLFGIRYVTMCHRWIRRMCHWGRCWLPASHWITASLIQSLNKLNKYVQCNGFRHSTTNIDEQITTAKNIATLRWNL